MGEKVNDIGPMKAVSSTNQMPTLKDAKAEKRSKFLAKDVIKEASDYSDPPNFQDDLMDIEGGQKDPLQLFGERSSVNEYITVIAANMQKWPTFFPASLPIPGSTKHRFCIIDWMLQVHRQLNMDPEVLSVAVSIFDRILSFRKVKKCHLRLFASTALWISSKLVETVIPSLADLVYLCGNAYVEHEFLDCERSVLKTIGFDFTQATLTYFIQSSGCQAFDSYITIFEYSAFFVEEFGKIHASLIASSVVFLAGLVDRSRPPIKRVILKGGNLERDIVQCAKLIAEAAASLMKEGSPDTLSIVSEPLAQMGLGLPEIGAEFTAKITENSLKFIDL